MVNEILAGKNIWQEIEIDNDFEPSIVSTRVQNDIEYKSMYISGLRVGDGAIRIFCVLARSVTDAKLPLVICAGDADGGVDHTAIDFWVNRGFACLCFDYAGKSESARFTMYPASISFANYSLSRETMFLLGDNVKSSCWYYYNSVAKTVLMFARTLKDIDINNIAFVGVKRGAKFAWNCSAFESDKVKVCAALFDGGWREYFRNLNLKDEEVLEMRENYLIHYSTSAIMPFVKVPTLFLGCSNNDNGYMDKICENLNRINPNVMFRYNLSMQQINTLGNNAKQTLVNFITKFLKNTQDYIPNKPTLNVKLEENKLLAEVGVDENCAVKQIKIYYSFDEKLAVNRYWNCIIAKGKSVEIDVKCHSSVAVIANVVYDNDLVFTTQLRIIDTAQVGCPIGFNVNSDRIIYSNDMPADGWAIYANESIGFEKMFLPTQPIAVQKGSSDIDGVKANAFCLATFKPFATRFKPNNQNFLRLDVHSPKSQELQICLIKKLGSCEEERYYCEGELVGGKIWQKIMLRQEDFKALNGAVLKSWEGISLIYFNADVAPLINNLIWV